MPTFFQDAFGGLAGTLETHTPDIGPGWVKKVGTGTSPGPNGSGSLNGGTIAEEFTYLANVAPGTTAYFAQLDDSASTHRNFPAVRMSSDGLSCYYAKYSGTNFQLYKRVAGADTFAGQVTMAAAGSVRIAAHNTGSDVVLEVYAGAAGGALALVLTNTDLASAPMGGVAPYTAAGNAGLIRFNLNVPADNFIAGTGAQPGVTAAVIALDVPGSDDTEVRLEAAPASGGTGAITYQWHRDTHSGFTPSGANDLPGETALALTDTPPDSEVYYYRIRATDAAAATADSATFGAALWEPPLAIGYMGDSLFAGIPADGTEATPTLISRHMQKLAGVRGAVGANMAVSGSASSHWVPGQANYTAAVAAFAAAGVDDVLYLIGTNNAPPGVPGGSTVARDAFEADVQDTVDALRVLGYNVMLCVPSPIFGPLDETRNNAVEMFIDSLAGVAATDPDHVHVIGADVRRHLWSHREQIDADGVHLLKLGVETAAAIYARDYAAVLDPASVGVAGGSFTWAA
jgi:hypothetical protein